MKIGHIHMSNNERVSKSGNNRRHIMILCLTYYKLFILQLAPVCKTYCNINKANYTNTCMCILYACSLCILQVQAHSIIILGKTIRIQNKNHKNFYIILIQTHICQTAMSQEFYKNNNEDIDTDVCPVLVGGGAKIYNA